MAGRLNLAAVGVMDKWLTGDPQYSHFLSRFRRSSKFSFEQIETPFDGTIDFGQEVTCRVPKDKGDLIRTMTLKITLSDPVPDLAPNPGYRNDKYYPPSVCAHLIEYADLVIGSQTIERITGEYIYMYNQLQHTNDDVDQTLYFLNGHGNFLIYRGDYSYFLDLPFYFYKNPSLAIPTCALTKQLVEVRLKLRPFSEMVWYGLSSTDVANGVSASIKNLSLDSEFVFVTPEERAYLMSTPLEYCITQLQMSKFVIPDGETQRSVMINFQGPVKEMYFTSQAQSAEALNLTGEYNNIRRVTLRFNDQVVFDMDRLRLTYAEPLRCHVNCPATRLDIPVYEPHPSLNPSGTHIEYDMYSEFGVKSFSERPEHPYPTGQVNMSRVAHKLLTVEIDPVYAGANNVRVYALSYNFMLVNAGLCGLKF